MLIIQNNKYKNYLNLWLVSLLLLLVSMIVIGGLTRLTGSGLSITNWDLLSGILPPINDLQWNNYFSLYKEIPQYTLINSNMTMDEFKIIYFWEYFHRLLGRVIGLVFLIPFLIFIYKKIFTNEYKIKFSLIFLLILLQGLIGWYMVKSGLTNNVTVSHIRLSVHLFLAFIILSSLFWYFLNLRYSTNKSFFNISRGYSLMKLFLLLLFIQIIMGAFVSGLDAGSIYQTWPLMNNSYVPDDLTFNSFFDFFNFNQQSFVQFLHRNLAYIILILYLYIGIFIKTHNFKKLTKPYLYLLIVLFFQIALGIFTLLSNLNIFVASLHQISIIFLMIFSLNLYHRSID